ncbi:hypothetical protein Deide_06472 [Deinococcus deserti VCD115]|uniref:Uncharacterized protein n=1 Tax=Deinococcus deserti (strain DSM 17065 / CIP 109153 / LMG 22923 / VCD115) TaxID=546414 RepID=C1D0X0_DEIDV|nr:hypothetical protein Deide_06472 [Deinococcus deserti VCD115]
MARHKRSTLPAVTLSDVEQRPSMVRRTANGWAWKCAYCGQFASSETLVGKYVCRSHGGVTPRQRSPEARDAARNAGQPVPQPPGRPLQTGLYSRRPKVRVDEIVADYQARQVNADHTDEDMLYLRAYLQQLKEVHPSVGQLAAPLEALQGQLQAGCMTSPDKGSEPACRATEAPAEVLHLVRETARVLRDITGFTEQLERRHERLIKLSKLRAETRLKDSAARQLEVFTLMLSRLQLILEEQLSPVDFAALQQRMARDLSELPTAAVKSSAGVRPARRTR